MRLFACVFFQKFYGIVSYIERSLKQFERVFLACLSMVWGCVLTSLIDMWLPSFPSVACWKDLLFSIVYSHLLCQGLIDCRYVGLVLGSLFCTFGLCVCLSCFCTSTMLVWFGLVWFFLPCCFDYCSLVVLSEVPKQSADLMQYLSKCLWHFSQN